MPTQGQESDDDWDFKVSLKPRTKRAAATLGGLAATAAVLIFEQNTGVSLADVVFAAKIATGK